MTISMYETTSKSRTASTIPDGWLSVRFEELAENIVEHIEIPGESGYDRFVGGDHLDSGSLKIRRWGSTTDVEAQKLLFKKGHILFGKRNAYLRKVAYADFDGVCSAHMLVLKAKPYYVLEEFLPFFMQTDHFWERAIMISEGSMSPTIKWKTLAQQEFVIPPKDKQRRIADILWAVEEAINRFQTVWEKLSSMSSLVLEKMLEKEMAYLNKSQNTERDSSKVTQWQKIALGKVLLGVQYGTSERSGMHIEFSVPVLRIPNVVRGNLDLSDLSWIVLSSEEQERYSVREGDILLVRTNGNPSHVGRSVIINNPPKNAVYASYLIRLRVDASRVRPAYVNTLLNSEYLRAKLRHEIRSSAGNYNLNTEGIKKQQIPLPTLLEQDQLLEGLNQFKSSAIKLTQHIEYSRTLKKRLLEYLFSASIKG